jgi:hypothetical protein
LTSIGFMSNPSLAMADAAAINWIADTEMPCPNEMAPASMADQDLNGLRLPAVSPGQAMPERRPKPKAFK